MQFVVRILALYRPRFNRAVVSLLQTSSYRFDKYLANFWRINDFNKLAIQPDAKRFAGRNETLRSFLDIGGLAQAGFGVILIILGASDRLDGGILLGVAAIISYPLVWAHLLVLPAFLFRLPGLPKEIGRQVVLSILGRQVKQLRASHKFKVIAVAGSAGKTSTKSAIAQVLGTKLKVRWQSGNYNDPVTVPLVFFDETEPSLYNVAAWLRLFKRNQQAIEEFDQDVVVVEVGTDGPGQMERFSKYLKADIGVLTAIAPEHMEFFGTLDNVASEELMLASFSQELLINSDLIDVKYRKRLKKTTDFAIDQKAAFRLTGINLKNKKHAFIARKKGRQMYKASVKLLSKNQLYSVAAATATASKLGFKNNEIEKAVAKIEPVNGRLNPLKGVKNSTILDDSYNSAPEAALAALETLYKIRAPQKIAILGSMNELGNYSEEAHRLVGEFCDPKQLDLVVTIGRDSGRWLAQVARDKGCSVKSYDNPYAAGAYVKGKIKNRALILVKGSQNGVFAEEAVKILLKSKKDASKLTRQSPAWVAAKDKQFSL